MFQKPLQVFEIVQLVDQFLEVFKAPRRFGGLVVLPMGRIAGFVENDLGQFDMGMLGGTIADRRNPVIDHRVIIDLDPGTACHRIPTDQPVDQLAQGFAALALDQPVVDCNPRAFDQRHAVLARGQSEWSAAPCRPSPRFGVFTIRSNARSSSGLVTSRK